VLEPGAGILRKHPRERPVQAFAGKLGGNGLFAGLLGHRRPSGQAARQFTVYSGALPLTLTTAAGRESAAATRRGIMRETTSSRSRQRAGGAGFFRAAALVFGLALLAGCAGNDEQENALLRDVTHAYETAERALNNQNYRRAI